MTGKEAQEFLKEILNSEQVCSSVVCRLAASAFLGILVEDKILDHRQSDFNSLQVGPEICASVSPLGDSDACLSLRSSPPEFFNKLRATHKFSTIFNYQLHAKVTDNHLLYVETQEINLS